MKTQHYLRWSLPAGFLVAVAALALAVWSYGYRQALNGLAERSAADLALASDRVSTQLQVYQELAVLTAEHPALANLSTPAAQDEAAELLRAVADKTAALDVFFAAADGRVLATGTPEEVRASEDPIVRRFLDRLPEPEGAHEDRFRELILGAEGGSG